MAHAVSRRTGFSLVAALCIGYVAALLVYLRIDDAKPSAAARV